MPDRSTRQTPSERTDDPGHKAKRSIATKPRKRELAHEATVLVREIETAPWNQRAHIAQLNFSPACSMSSVLKRYFSVRETHRPQTQQMT